MERPTLPLQRVRPDSENLAQENTNSRTSFKLRRASFKGRGLRTEIQGAAWETLCDLCYGARPLSIPDKQD